MYWCYLNKCSLKCYNGKQKQKSIYHEISFSFFNNTCCTNNFYIFIITYQNLSERKICFVLKYFLKTYLMMKIIKTMKWIIFNVMNNACSQFTMTGLNYFMNIIINSIMLQNKVKNTQKLIRRAVRYISKCFE